MTSGFDLEHKARAILGINIDTDINLEIVKQAFRRKAKQTHPDLNNKQYAEKYFKLVVHANEYLRGIRDDDSLLNNNDLVGAFLGIPICLLGMRYYEWMEERGFYEFLGA